MPVEMCAHKEPAQYCPWCEIEQHEATIDQLRAENARLKAAQGQMRESLRMAERDQVSAGIEAVNVDRLKAELDKCQAKLAEAEKDARRYRHLRSLRAGEFASFIDTCDTDPAESDSWYRRHPIPESFDSAIDAAIEREGGK